MCIRSSAHSCASRKSRSSREDRKGARGKKEFRRAPAARTTCAPARRAVPDASSRLPSCNPLLQSRASSLRRLRLALLRILLVLRRTRRAVSARHQRRGEILRARQIHAFEFRLAQDRGLQVRALEIRSLNIRVAKIRRAKIGLPQNSAAASSRGKIPRRPPALPSGPRPPGSPRSNPLCADRRFCSCALLKSAEEASLRAGSLLSGSRPENRRTRVSPLEVRAREISAAQDRRALPSLAADETARAPPEFPPASCRSGEFSAATAIRRPLMH